MPIPIGFENCLLHYLRILPHQSTVHSTKCRVLIQFCVEVRHKWRQKLLSPGCKCCTSCTWKVGSWCSCAVSQTAVAEACFIYDLTNVTLWISICSGRTKKTINHFRVFMCDVFMSGRYLALSSVALQVSYLNSSSHSCWNSFVRGNFVDASIDFSV